MKVLDELFGDPLKHARKGIETKVPRDFSHSPAQEQAQERIRGVRIISNFSDGGAYAFSFAVDLLVGGLIGIYPATAFLPVVTWSILSAICLLPACLLTRFSRWLALPYAGFGALAVFGGMVGAHSHNYIVACAMFLHTYFIWKGAKRMTTQPHVAGNPKVKGVKAGRWDDAINGCDFLMARDEIATLHRRLNEEAKQKSGEYLFTKEYVLVWDAFCNDPRIETARVLLNVAPSLLHHFQNCCPGGVLYATKHGL